MKLSLIFHNSDITDFSKSRVQNLIYKKLLTFSGHEFEVINPLSLDIDMLGSPTNLKSMLMFTIVNSLNNKAIIINLSDRLEPTLVPDHGFDSFDVVQIIGGMSIERSFYEMYKERLDKIRKPLMIPVDKVSEDNYLFQYVKPHLNKIKKAIFIGNVYGGRSEIVDVLKKHPLFDIRHSIREEGYKFSDYLDEIQKHTICLSLNGYAEICYRDIESMAIQVPVLRSEFSNDYYEEIVADYHYIVGSEASNNGFLGYNKSPKEIADQFIARIEAVIDDEEYLNSIALNGRHYYEKNCTIQAIANNATKLIDFNLLK